MNFVYMAAGLLGSPSDLGIPSKAANAAGIQGILGVVYMIAAIIAVIVMIVAGITYATSGGDSGKVTKAKNTMLYAVIGFVIVLVAFGLTIWIARLAT